MPLFERPKHRTWARRFGGAFRGVTLGAKGQACFFVHSVFAISVVLLAAFFRVTWQEGCLLTLCITAVLAAEMFNSAVETLAKAIDRNYNQHLAEGLDIASAAVLITAFGAALVGATVLGRHAVLWLGLV